MEQQIVSYLRVSTKGQQQSGLGIEAQRAYVEAYCHRHRATVLREFVEIESGRNCDRKVLRQAIAFTKRAKGVLVIAKLDRLARNVAFVANLMQTSVKFQACDIDGANDMTIHVMAAVAQNEVEAISKRTKDALQAAKERGTLLGAHNPLAKPLTADARIKGQVRSAQVNRSKAVAEYADLVPMIRELRAEGLSLRAIASRLGADGQSPRGGGQWNAVQVKRILDRVTT